METKLKAGKYIKKQCYMNDITLTSREEKHHPSDECNL